MAKKKEVKNEIERDYVVPLRKGFRRIAGYKKSAKAMRTLRIFLEKHMKSDKVRIGLHINEYIWANGGKNPPHHVKVHVWKSDDEVRAELHGFEFKEAVKAEKKKEPETMKEKLAAKLGVDEKAEKDSEKKEALPEAAPEKNDEAKTEEKKESSAEPKVARKKPAKKQ
ncbi:MAG: 50S ribosomal protein L31e [archaeon]